MNRFSTLYFLLSILLCSALACTNSQPSQSTVAKPSHPPLYDTLIGAWNTIAIKATYHALTDTSKIVETPPEAYEQEFNMKPIRTHYYENGTYLMEYRTLEDSIFSKTGGTWLTKGDTLIMNHGGLPKTTYKYQVQLTGNSVTFTGWLDLDRDGHVDDIYQGTQLRHP